jgi:SMI1-KNR4 cell-wall
MAMPTVANLVNRINAELSDEHEVNWHGSASEADLQAIEHRLGCRLPRSFREFLLLTGGGGLGTLNVSDSDVSENLGSVIGDTLYWRDEYGMPSHLVAIQCDDDDNEPFCLDTSAFRGEECPVILYYPHVDDDVRVQWIAPDFPTWYAKYLEPYFTDGGTGS